MLANLSDYHPIHATVTNCRRVATEAEFFSAPKEEVRDLDVWAATVHLDDIQFDNIIFADGGSEALGLYGHDMDLALVQTHLPNQAPLLAYLSVRTKENALAFGILSQLFSGTEQRGLRAVVKAYSLARGHSTEDDWQ